jgi:branched-chain amino acid transport system substrate-binding protein
LKRPRAFSFVVALLFTFALSGIPSAGRGAGEPFEIYLIVALTGQGAFIGQEMVKALAADEAYINKNGGINGRPIKIVVSDDLTNPQVTNQIMSGYLAKKPAVVVGGLLNTQCYAQATLLRPDSGPVLWCFAPGVKLGPWMFTTGYSIPGTIAVAMRYFRAKGWMKIAQLTMNDANGQDTDKAIADVLSLPENKSLSVVVHDKMALTDISVAAQVEHIRNSGAQAVIAWLAGPNLGTFLRNYRDAGLSLPILTTFANVNHRLLEGYKSFWPNAPLIMAGFPALVPDAVPDRAVRQAVSRFYDAMRQGGIDRPEVADAITWEPINIIVDAYRHLGTDATAAQLRDYVNGIRSRSSIYGHMDFKASPGRGVLPEWVMLVDWDPNKAEFFAISKPGGEPLKR